jgi:C-terminal processing protease CtpA/Prc
VAPIAPTVQILGGGEAIADAPALTPASTAGLEGVAWQYRGPGYDGEGGGGAYTGKRTGRTASSPVGGSDWTALARSIDATAHRGKPFRLRARVRASGGARASVWARVDLAGGQTGFFDNMMDRMVTSSGWTEVTIDGTFDAGAQSLAFGGLVMGGGDAGFDDFALTVDGVPVALDNAGFEGGEAGWSTGAGDGYAADVVTDAAEGGKALRLTRARTELADDLFAERARPGEIADVELGGGLRARVPIALWSQDQQTLPAGDPAALAGALAAADTTVADPDARVADVIVTWSVLDQFYPYFDVIDVDWPARLDAALRDALDDVSPVDHHHTLLRLVAAIEDGHGSAFVDIGPQAAVPARLGWVEEQLVVLGSATPALARGDVIEAIDGVAAADALDAAMALQSGTPQWRRTRALWELGSGPTGTEVTLRLARAGGAVDVTLPRGMPPDEWFLHPPIAELDGGIWYVDLGRAEMAAITAAIDAIAAAPGVVFDLRGYPNSTHDVLNHLLDRPEDDRWMHVARHIRPAVPGAPRPAPEWDSFGWDLQPASPRITGKVVFLTGGGAISYAESVMGYAEALGLDIVGGTTAGANGNVRVITLPTGARVPFTGMKVTRHDGTRSHAIGIRPTVPAESTIAGIRAGRDEVLDRALALVTAAVSSRDTRAAE